MREIAFVANLGTRAPPNGQVVKARAIQSLLVSLGSVSTIETSTDRLALLRVAAAARRGCALVIVLNRKGLWAALLVIGLARATTRRQPVVIVAVVGGWLPRFLAKRWYRVVLRQADDFLVESHRLADALAQQDFGATVFPNFRQRTRPPRDGSQEPGRPLRLCMAGRVRRDKGVLEAMDVVDELGKLGVAAELDVFGPIEEVELEPRLRRIGVRYGGILEDREVPATLEQHDLLLLPSRYEGECMPGAVVEAMLLGIPAVVTRWQDLPELVADGITGLVCHVEGFAAEAARRIAACLADDELARMALAAAAYGTAHLTDEAAATILVEVLARHGVTLERS